MQAMKPIFKFECARKYNGFVSKVTKMRLLARSDTFDLVVTGRLSQRSLASKECKVEIKVDIDQYSNTHEGCCAASEIPSKPLLRSQLILIFQTAMASLSWGNGSIETLTSFKA